ncbi:uncharacterized protein LDX57_007322 [Aspergillus melleus]|uniref:uncharacterized protein n=1 Tax=Aspergillus melleus TaxID=138277 RepID=UPI001E8CA388|nr:uncharacterized protein LDX57_007322 [Aspergillus melleus]KAH8429650.1 hypothetical protein LDX57_007322 [Aspergillus melleus]
MPEDYNNLLQKVVEAVKGIDALPVSDYTNRVHYKCCFAQRAAEFRDNKTLNYGTPWPDDDPRPSGPHLNDQSVSFPLCRLIDGTIPRALEKTQFANRVNKENANKVLNDQIVRVATLCYCEHVTRKLAAAKVEALNKLRSYSGFGAFMKDRLKKKPFIQGVIRDDARNGSHIYSMTLLFIADFLDRGDLGIPALDDGFVFAPSLDILGIWSKTLWELDGKERMDQTVKFCGRLATAVYSPGLGDTRQPRETYTVTTKLYEKLLSGKSVKDPYVKDAQESLKKLVEDDANAWKSSYLLLWNSWNFTAYPRWRDTIQKELSINNGRAVGYWITDGVSYEDQNSVPDHLRVLRKETANGSHIVAGTQIALVDRQSVPVEELVPGDQVLSLASEDGPNQSAQVSDSMFPQQATVPLVGFNNGDPFAPTWQVFHTTTGLRAVDPEAAMHQNPWLKVGRLLAGHIVYRLKGNNDKAKNMYERFSIKSIERTTPVLRTVYELRLHDAVRLHHSNGFLVQVNFPEITVDYVASLLKALPAAKRMTLLYALEDLRPLFERFGASSIADRLHAEIYGGRRYKKGPLRGVPKPKFQRNASLTNVTRSFKLKSTQGTLSKVALVEGFLLLDGEVQNRATLDEQTNTVRWTRKVTVPDGKTKYEFGMFRLYSAGRGGNGLLFYTNEPNPKKVPKDKVIRFRAASNQNSRGLDDTAGETSPEDQGEAEEGSIMDEKSAPRINFANDYAVKVDKTIWEKGTLLEKPRDPVNFGIISLGTETMDDGVEIPVVAIPVLDQLQQEINKVSKTKIGKLYTSYEWDYSPPDDKDKTVHRTIVEFNNAALLPFITDGGPDYKTFGLTFNKTLQSAFRLPVLFHSLYVETSWDEMSLTGALYEYDPQYRGMKGSRHLLVGDYADDDFNLKAQRAKISKAFSDFAKPGVPIQRDPHLQPPAVTKELTTMSATKLQDLKELPNYKEAAVHSATQDLVQRMVWWHMDASQRQTFTTADKPPDEDLPRELRENLDPKLKEFIRNKYGPAFISRSITQIRQHKDKFTEEERKKVWYWWEGSGPTCLSRSKEFQQLNNLASIHAMRKLHSDTLDKYLPEAQKWAEALLDHLCKPPVLKSIMGDRISGKLGNIVNKECCILNTLAPNSNLPDKWFKKMISYASSHMTNIPDITEEVKDWQRQWLYGIMEELIFRVLSNDDSIVKAVRDGLEEDLKEFEKANNLNSELNAKDRARNIMEKQSVLAFESANWLSAIGKSLALIPKAFSGTRLFQWFGRAFGEVLNKVGSKVAGAKFMLGVTVISMASYSIGQIYNLVGAIVDWNNLNGSQRAVVILETIRTVVTALDQVKDAWNRVKTKTGTPTQIALDEFVLDRSLGNAIESDPKRISNVADEVHGPHGLQEGVSKKVNGGGLPAHDEVIKGDGERWTEKINEPPGDVPPGAKDDAKRFSMQGKWLQCLNVILGLGVGVAMTFSLVHDWDNLTDVGKVINTLSVVVQFLTVILDLVELGAAVGLFVLTGTMAVAIPIIGAVLAVLGIVLTIIGLFFNLYKKETPPDPVGDFIRDTARPLVANWASPPGPKLSYTLSPTSVASDTTSTVTITGKNNNSKEVKIVDTRISLLGGGDDPCLFQDMKFNLVAETASDRHNAGKSYVSPAGVVKANLSSTQLAKADPEYWQFEHWVAGAIEASGHLNIGAGKSFTSVWTGLINRVGLSVVEIIEKFEDGDKAYCLLETRRV